MDRYEFKGTPGKWRAERRECNEEIDPDYCVVLDEMGNIICETSYNDADIQIQQHNAYATAAVPEMIEGIKEAMAELRFHNWHNTTTYNNLQSILNKALNIKV